jgi:hypothetical protein
MDKTIETKFFEAFKWSGVVDKCIYWIRYTYNLPPMKPRASTKEREETPEQRKAKEKWDKYYRETLPKEILEATEAFDDSVIMYMDSPLMDEIEANLNDCQTDAQRESYLFSLLKPFGESGCGIARIYTPTAEINQLNEAIRGCERDKAFWQTMPEGEQIKNVNGEPSGTPKEQIEACNSMIARYKEQIEWVLNVNHQFIDLTCTDKDKVGSVERCLSAFVGVTVIFANRLDALLLTYGIDLMRLQKESGLYLKDHRQITDVDSYIGSMELAQKYIDALPKEPQQEQTTDAQSLNPEPQQEQPKPTRGRGRPKETLKDKMIDDANWKKLQKIHTKICGKKGKDATLIILACIKKGWMAKPTYTQVKNEFGDIGSKTGFNKYLKESMFTQEEIEGAIASLD